MIELSYHPVRSGDAVGVVSIIIAVLILAGAHGVGTDRKARDLAGQLVRADLRWATLRSLTRGNPICKSTLLCINDGGGRHGRRLCSGPVPEGAGRAVGWTRYVLLS
jgi:hypothetical protein